MVVSTIQTKITSFSCPINHKRLLDRSVTCPQIIKQETTGFHHKWFNKKMRINYNINYTTVISTYESAYFDFQLCTK
jgi:hypothetical protein